MRYFCPECGAEYEGDVRFCGECGAQLLMDGDPEEMLPMDEETITAFEEGEVSGPPPEGMPEGINYYNDQFFWEGECSIFEYGTVFKGPTIIVCLIGGLIALILFLAGMSTGGAVTLLISAGVWLFLFLFMLLERSGRFTGHFSIQEGMLEVSEEMKPPKNIILKLIYGILWLVTSLLQLAWTIMGLGAFAMLFDIGRAIQRTAKLKSVTGVDVSSDGRFLLVHKGMGTLKMVCAPEQSAFLAEQIRRKAEEARGIKK